MGCSSKIEKEDVKKIIFDLNLGHVNSTNDFLSSNAFSNTSPSPVNQSHYIASFSCGLRHNCCLSSRINKSFDGVTVDHTIDVQHNYSTKSFRTVLHSHLHILLNIFLSYLLCNEFLSFHVHWISGQKPQPGIFTFKSG